MTARHPVAAVVPTDIENAIGSNAQTPAARARLAALLDHVPAQARIRPDVERALAERGIQLLAASSGKNAANNLPLTCARRAAHQGHRYTTWHPSGYCSPTSAPEPRCLNLNSRSPGIFSSIC
ncbi:hypothetical protein ACFU99_11945 [Streptomyces sp. NPDC057654]|uniref:hypothetical protein n=1 Tax=Streptomyces sp. NPDC057654 TaxID=3346196 RepID=UPI0036966514